MQKKTIALLGFLLFATQAMAEDITNPFYMPLKGKMLSETSVVFVRDRFDDGRIRDTNENTFLTEKATVGVSDNFSMSLSLGNRFSASGSDENVYWGAEAVFAPNFADHPEWLTQFGLAYRQERSHRDFDAFTRIGYLADMIFLPYVEARFSQPVNYGPDKNEAEVTVRAAGYSMISQTVGVRAGVEAVFNHEGTMRYESEGKRRRAFSLFGEADYAFNDTMAIGVTGGWIFHETGTDSTGYNIGATFKIAF